jgi:hypothetical protein
MRVSSFDICKPVSMLIVVGLGESLKPLPGTRLDMLESDLEKELNEVGALFPMRFVWGRKPVDR